MRHFLQKLVNATCVGLCVGAFLAGCAGGDSATRGLVTPDELDQLDALLIGDRADEEKAVAVMDEATQFSDPVVKTVRGNIAMSAGDFAGAVGTFREVITLLEGKELPTAPRRIVDSLATPSQNRPPVVTPVTQDAQCLASFRHYFTGTGTHREVLGALKDRDGFVAYPPTFEKGGTTGLIFEVLNEHAGRRIFRFRSLQYCTPGRKEEAAHSDAVIIAGINLMTASVLAFDRQGVEEAEALLARVSRPDAESRFFICFGWYLLEHPDFDSGMISNPQLRALFQ